MHQLTYSEAVVEAIAEEMHRDPTVFILGQAVGEFDDVYYPGISRLSREGFDKARIHETGIIERFEAGAGFGAALTGSRPIVDLQMTSMGGLAESEVFGNAALWGYMHGRNGKMRIPVVFRMTIATRSNGDHARSRIANYMHGVGLKVVIPSNPYDAKGLMKTAIRDDNPVVFLDSNQLFRDRADIPDEEYLIPFGVSSVIRKGDACTVVCVSDMVKLAQKAADLLAAEGISIEIIDPRTLIPLDIDAIVASVRKTGRLLVIDDDVIRCGVGAEIGFQVQEQAFKSLKAPIQRLGNPNLPVPANKKLQALLFPNVEKIVKAVKRTLEV
jgi:acetoin:2,6-dichlorophenolindophenol oxidoreductase subunit beta